MEKDKEKVVGIYAYPWFNEFTIQNKSKNPLKLLKQAIWFKSNPRSAEYLEHIFKDKYPTGTFTNWQIMPRQIELIAKADTIVLLYPDSIGLGFFPIEQKIKSYTKKSALFVLNGRQRCFKLTLQNKLNLYMRRFLERFMILELLFIPVFIILTPVLLVIDIIQGKR